jgi:hypothetical protein
VLDCGLNGLMFEPNDSDPNQRWKAVVIPHHSQRSDETKAIHPYRLDADGNPSHGEFHALHTSPDGIRWTKKCNIGIF